MDAMALEEFCRQLEARIDRISKKPDREISLDTMEIKELIKFCDDTKKHLVGPFGNIRVKIGELREYAKNAARNRDISHLYIGLSGVRRAVRIQFMKLPD